MAHPLEPKILKVLRGVKMPGRDEDIVALNIVANLTIEPVAEGAQVSFVLEVDPAEGPKLEPLRLAAEQAVKNVKGVAAVTAVLTAHKQNSEASKPMPEQLLLPGVRHTIAIASGKGGVGKSTTAVNLAVAMAGEGRRVGLLDADIYGPSIPRMLGLSEKPRLDDDDKLLPLERHGVKVLSIGNLIPEEAPVIWRGPMVHSALRQLLSDVAWGELDVLVVDMPPGTGDAPLTLAHLVPLAGAVIVSTPQDVALLDARKAIGLFQKLNVPILGIVENMSMFVCPHCGGQSDIFGHGGARAEAERLNVPFLGEVPLDLAVRETSDAGTPIVAAQPESAQAKGYRAMAQKVWAAFGVVSA